MIAINAALMIAVKESAYAATYLVAPGRNARSAASAKMEIAIISVCAAKIAMTTHVSATTGSAIRQNAPTDAGSAGIAAIASAAKFPDATALSARTRIAASASYAIHAIARSNTETGHLRCCTTATAETTAA